MPVNMPVPAPLVGPSLRRHSLLTEEVPRSTPQDEADAFALVGSRSPAAWRNTSLSGTAGPPRNSPGRQPAFATVGSAGSAPLTEPPGMTSTGSSMRYTVNPPSAASADSPPDRSEVAVDGAARQNAARVAPEVDVDAPLLAPRGESRSHSPHGSPSRWHAINGGTTFQQHAPTSIPLNGISNLGTGANMISTSMSTASTLEASRGVADEHRADSCTAHLASDEPALARLSEENVSQWHFPSSGSTHQSNTSGLGGQLHWAPGLDSGPSDASTTMRSGATALTSGRYEPDEKHRWPTGFVINELLDTTERRQNLRAKVGLLEQPFTSEGAAWSNRGTARSGGWAAGVTSFSSARSVRTMDRTSMSSARDHLSEPFQEPLCTRLAVSEESGLGAKHASAASSRTASPGPRRGAAAGRADWRSLWELFDELEQSWRNAADGQTDSRVSTLRQLFRLLTDLETNYEHWFERERFVRDRHTHIVAPLLLQMRMSRERQLISTVFSAWRVSSARAAHALMSEIFEKAKAVCEHRRLPAEVVDVCTRWQQHRAWSWSLLQSFSTWRLWTQDLRRLSLLSNQIAIAAGVAEEVKEARLLGVLLAEWHRNASLHQRERWARGAASDQEWMQAQLQHQEATVAHLKQQVDGLSRRNEKLSTQCEEACRTIDVWLDFCGDAVTSRARGNVSDLGPKRSPTGNPDVSSGAAESWRVAVLNQERSDIFAELQRVREQAASLAARVDRAQSTADAMRLHLNRAGGGADAVHADEAAREHLNDAMRLQRSMEMELEQLRLREASLHQSLQEADGQIQAASANPEELLQSSLQKLQVHMEHSWVQERQQTQELRVHLERVEAEAERERQKMTSERQQLQQEASVASKSGAEVDALRQQNEELCSELQQARAMVEHLQQVGDAKENSNKFLAGEVEQLSQIREALNELTDISAQVWGRRTPQRSPQPSPQQSPEQSPQQALRGQVPAERPCTGTPLATSAVALPPSTLPGPAHSSQHSPQQSPQQAFRSSLSAEAASMGPSPVTSSTAPPASMLAGPAVLVVPPEPGANTSRPGASQQFLQATPRCDSVSSKVTSPRRLDTSPSASSRVVPQHTSDHGGAPGLFGREQLIQQGRLVPVERPQSQPQSGVPSPAQPHSSCRAYSPLPHGAPVITSPPAVLPMPSGPVQMPASIPTSPVRSPVPSPAMSERAIAADVRHRFVGFVPITPAARGHTPPPSPLKVHPRSLPGGGLSLGAYGPRPSSPMHERRSMSPFLVSHVSLAAASG